MKSIAKFLLLIISLFSFRTIYGQADPGSSGMGFTQSIFQINGKGALEVIIGNYSGGFSTGKALTPYDATFTISIPYILKVNGPLDFSKVPFDVIIVSQMSTFSGSTVIKLTVPDGIPKGSYGTVKIPLVAVKGDAEILYATVVTEFNLSYPPSGNLIPGNDLMSAPVSVISPLPVTLLSFKATKENTQVNLDWSTTSETNSDRFDIEHSQDGKDWNLIGSVASGVESKSRLDYHFLHTNPSNGNNYYRLKMIDKDETFAFSSIKNIEFENLDLEIFPNPVADHLTIKTNNWVNVNNIRLINLSGATVYDSGKTPLQSVNVTNLKQGIYIMKIGKTDGSWATQKIIVSR
ncbi:T9SS type A sorting domain-containing protein [Dyadobacter subterraneus]|uniref:T9SS type A sorting domain-containing protein n=1 Tax=Dyadobacter subterraneus TaxID=2773304 RepID=A0ABR9WP13_9BACT|nr:T9SS type A sorting domain-containing protein [Dyadobacter subterraneus]MBE9466591.1 T9SS type A sorting domain-containing protein [Dyadobacter subterraneus]